MIFKLLTFQRIDTVSREASILAGAIIWLQVIAQAVIITTKIISR